MQKYLISFLVLFLAAYGGYSQLAGNYTINSTLPTAGTNFASFTDAINALNSSGVSNTTGATFLVASGQTFNENPPVLTASGSAGAPIVFVKQGVLANPVVTPSAPGTILLGTTTTNFAGNGDAVISIAGGDHLVFDGIDIGLNTSFANGTQYYEYGYAIFRATGTDASQNVTIRNATINMQPVLPNSAGIYVSNLNAAGAPVTTVAISGRSEKLLIRKNMILNAYHGIVLRGFADPNAPYALQDHFVMVDSNTIQGFGGGSTECYGIYMVNQDSALLAENTIVSASTSASVYGIRAAAAPGASVSILGNTLSLSIAATGSMYGIDNFAGGAGGGNTVDIGRNKIINCTHAGTGSLYPIRNSVNPSFVNIYENEIANIMNSGTGTMYCIYSIPSGNTTVNKVYKNHIHDLSNTNTANTSTLYGYVCNGSAETHLYQNHIHDITHSGNTGSIINRSNGTNFYCYNNVYYRLYTPNSTNVDAIRAIDILNGNNSQKVFFNTVYLDAVSASTTTYGNSALYVSSTTSTNVEIRNNILVNASTAGPTGGYVCAYRRSTTTLTNYNTASNNNCYYADVQKTRHVIYSDGTNHLDMPGFQALVGPTRESASFTELPPFNNVTTAPYDLVLSTTIATLCANAATAVTTPVNITTDAYDNARGNPADLGAYEIGSILSLNALRLRADHAANNVSLLWQAEGEEGNGVYFVERSDDGREFKIVASERSAAKYQYDFVDGDALKIIPVRYYRIRYRGEDGVTQYSNIVRVSAGPDNRRIMVAAAPNPFNSVPEITLESAVDGEAVVEIVNVTGKKSYTGTMTIQKGMNRFTMDEFRNYPAGLYVLNVLMANERVSLKLVKSN